MRRQSLLARTSTLGQSMPTMTTDTEHCHIVTDSQIAGGEPIIKGTRITVRDVVEVWRMGTPAEEISRSFPHLTQAQIFDALSYYSDHQEEIHSYIERNRIPQEWIDRDAHRS